MKIIVGYPRNPYKAVIFALSPASPQRRAGDQWKAHAHFRPRNVVKIVAFQPKLGICVTSTSDISTKPTPLCSPSSPPSNEPNCIAVGAPQLEIAYLHMLFILQLTCTASSAGQLGYK